MPARTCLTIVLAAGEGTRMRSSRPKVLHTVAGRSLLGHVLTAVQAAGSTAIAVVLGPEHDDVSADVRSSRRKPRSLCKLQRRGTAHAVLAAKAGLEKGADDILVVVRRHAVDPAARPWQQLRASLADGAAVAVLGFRPADPTGYGRLVTKGDELLAIVEHADATDSERGIALCNGGLMALDGKHGADDPGAHRQCQSQGRILSDRCGDDCARHESARRSRSK